MIHGANPFEPLDPAPLVNQRLVGATVDLWDWRSWSAWAGATWPDTPNVITVETDEMAIQAAISGAGIALAEVRFVASELASGILVPACNCYGMEIGYYTAVRVGQQRPEISSTVNAWLREIAQDAYHQSMSTIDRTPETV